MKPDVSRDQLSDFTISPGQFEELLADHEQLTNTHIERQGLLGAANDGGRVVGVGITENKQAGEGDGTPALLMLIEKLDPDAALPSVSAHGIPIVYEEAGEIQAAGYNGHYRPVQGGVSIAPCPTTYSGTLGCVVQSNNIKYILSNNHVLADINALPAGTTISQPSRADGGQCPADVIASLSYSVPIVLGGYTAADAAIAAIAAGANVDPRILRDNNAVQRLVAPVTAPMLNIAVQKSGRTTGYTKAAQIRAIGVMVVVNMGMGGNSTFRNIFTVQRVSGDFSLPGDSGSLITTDPSNQPVGLLFAVSVGNHMTYASPMTDVLAALQTQTGHPVSIVY